MATAAEIAAVQAELDIATAARTAIMERGQEVVLNGRRLTRVDLGDLNKYISQVKNRLSRLSAGGSMRRAVPE